MSRHPQLVKQVLEFIARNGDPSKLLLGWSGGPDSMALFLALLVWRRCSGHSFGVAHLDHNWRAESGSEARYLEEIALQEGVPFHSHRWVDPPHQNQEEAAREKRLTFFSDLCRSHGYEVLLLGHHADDQAETVLQRVLEGASWRGLGGIRARTEWRGVTILRPLCHTVRVEIETFLESSPYVPLSDPSNQDRRYLRNRFRHDVLPYLSESLGKEVRGNLVRLGRRMQEWEGYLDRRLAPLEKGWKRGPIGSWIAFESTVEPLEWEWLLRGELLRRSLTLSDEEVQIASRRLSGCLGRLLWRKREVTIAIDRGRLFFLEHGNDSWSLGRGCKKAVLGWGEWSEGVLSTVVPAGEYQLAPPTPSAPFSGSCSLSRWWTAHKVPHFLRNLPVVWRGDRIIGEFLTGRPQIQKGETRQILSLFSQRALQ